MTPDVDVAQPLLPPRENVPVSGDVTVAPTPPLAETEEQLDAGAAGALSQWQLIRRRFSKHKLAVASVYVLALMYFVAIFAEFIAPYPPNARHIEYGYCPPQLIRFDFRNGLHTGAMRCEVDPVTFKRLTP